MQTIMEISGHYANKNISARQPTPGKETEMVRRFIDYKQNRFCPTNNNHLMIFVEPMIDNSYPDIVFVEYNPEKFIQWSQLRNELTKTDYKILYYIYISEKVNADDIVTRIGTSWKETAQALEKLYDSKLIYRKLGHWRSLRKNLIGTNKIEAVEAKINKIDEAYKQALQNHTFASESYILSNQNKRIDENVHMPKIKKAGIGVYTQSVIDYKFNKITKSYKREIPVSLNSFLVNEWIGKVIHANQ